MLNLKQSLRSFSRSPGFTGLVVGVPAIGIGANAAMFTLIDRLRMHSFNYRDVAGLVEIPGRNN